MSIFGFFRRRETRIRDHVTFSGEAVTRTRPDGVVEMIRWDDLQEVAVLTTDEGPWLEDVFFLLIASDPTSGCAVPQSSDGSKQLLERLQQLPNFDNEALIEAMGSTTNGKFVCWKRQAG